MKNVKDTAVNARPTRLSIFFFRKSKKKETKNKKIKKKNIPSSTSHWQT